MGQASISSNRVSTIILEILSKSRREPAYDLVEQLPSLGVPETCHHRHIPQPLIHQRPASYGILLSHEHGKSVIECQVPGGEGMMIGEGMLDHIDAVSTQVPEETPRVADPGDGVHPLAAEVLQRLRTRPTIQPVRLAAVEGHLQGGGREPALPGEQRRMLRNTVDDNDTGLPDPG